MPIHASLTRLALKRPPHGRGGLPMTLQHAPAVRRRTLSWALLSLPGLLLLLAGQTAQAHTVMYALSGEMTVEVLDDPVPKEPFAEPYSGTFRFDAHSDPMPQPDPSFYWYRPIAEMRLTFLEEQWVTVDTQQCSMEMHVAYADISFWCQLVNPQGSPASIFMRISDTSGVPLFQEPHPLGPFQDGNWRDMETVSLAYFQGQGFEARGAVGLDDVRVISEPASLWLQGAAALTLLPWPQRRRRTGTLPEASSR